MLHVQSWKVLYFHNEKWRTFSSIKFVGNLKKKSWTFTLKIKFHVSRMNCSHEFNFWRAFLARNCGGAAGEEPPSEPWRRRVDGGEGCRLYRSDCRPCWNFFDAARKLFCRPSEAARTSSCKLPWTFGGRWRQEDSAASPSPGKTRAPEAFCSSHHHCSYRLADLMGQSHMVTK